MYLRKQISANALIKTRYRFLINNITICRVVYKRPRTRTEKIYVCDLRKRPNLSIPPYGQGCSGYDFHKMGNAYFHGRPAVWPFTTNCCGSLGLSLELLLLTSRKYKGRGNIRVVSSFLTEVKNEDMILMVFHFVFTV